MTFCFPLCAKKLAHPLHSGTSLDFPRHEDPKISESLSGEGFSRHCVLAHLLCSRPGRAASWEMGMEMRYFVISPVKTKY